MSWLPQNYGRDPAEIAAAAGMSVHGGGHPIQQRNQWADAIAKIAPALMAALKQKRNDEIANQIMNQWAPPRAEAVDQSGATYDPALAASQGYSGPEPQASQPFTSGAEGLQAHQLYQKMLRQDESADRQGRLQEARITHLNTPRVMGRETDGNKAITAYQQEVLRLREMDIKRKADRYGKKLGPHELITAPDEYPVTKGPDTPMGGPTPVEEPTIDKTPVQVSTPEEAQALAPGTYYLDPQGKLHKR